VRGQRQAAAALVTAVVLACALGLGLPAAALATAPARVQGRFAMRAHVTLAVGVPGEHRGERLRRTWRIRPADCRRDVCRTLRLRRNLSAGRTERVTLHRHRNGTYLGRGEFFVALSCRGRVYRHGSRAHFTIRLRVTATRTLGGIRFARRLAATYNNTSRTDSTPCTLGEIQDSARYAGRLRGGTPTPPRASFSPQITARGPVAFVDTSRPGSGPGRLVASWRWSFGDPASGAANRSRRPAPDHTFSGPGHYRVRLTVTDAAGLRATVARTVVIAAPAGSVRPLSSAASSARG
jgi:hypothetical protein